MQPIENLLQQLDQTNNVDAVRREVVALIRRELGARRVALDAPTKIHFANAIGALSMNVHSLQQPTTGWLRLSLADLERATAPPSAQTSASGTAPGIDEHGYDDLIAALDAVAREIGMS